MLYGLYISAGGLRVNQLRQAVGSNNLANSGTVGFKLDRVTAADVQRVAQTYLDTRQCTIGHYIPE